MLANLWIKMINMNKMNKMINISKMNKTNKMNENMMRNMVLLITHVIANSKSKMSKPLHYGLIPQFDDSVSDTG